MPFPATAPGTVAGDEAGAAAVAAAAAAAAAVPGAGDEKKTGKGLPLMGTPSSVTETL